MVIQKDYLLPPNPLLVNVCPPVEGGIIIPAPPVEGGAALPLSTACCASVVSLPTKLPKAAYREAAKFFLVELRFIPKLIGGGGAPLPGCVGCASRSAGAPCDGPSPVREGFAGASVPSAAFPLFEKGSDLAGVAVAPLFFMRSFIVGGGAAFFCSGPGSSPGKIHLVLRQVRKQIQLDFWIVADKNLPPLCLIEVGLHLRSFAFRDFLLVLFGGK